MFLWYLVSCDHFLSQQWLALPTLNANTRAAQEDPIHFGMSLGLGDSKKLLSRLS